MKLLFAISPYKSNESRALVFLAKDQERPRTNREGDRVDRSEPSVERWTAEAAQWSKQKTSVLSYNLFISNLLS